MQRALPIGALGGTLVAVLVHRFVYESAFLAAGIAALYAGWVYFLVRYGWGLALTAVDFEDRPDRLAYGVGVLGSVLAPIAVTEYVSDGLGLAVVLAWLGVLGFLVTTRAAAVESQR